MTSAPSPATAATAATPARAVTVVLVAYENEARCRVRLDRDLAPTLRAYPHWRFELVVVDNSARRLDGFAGAVAALGHPCHYLWQAGANLRHGPAMNVAARLAAHPVLVYACTNHGRMVDPGWLDDLVRPFDEDGDQRVAMAGHLYPNGDPTPMGFRDDVPRVHIQGGIVALRTEIVRRHPYDEGPYGHAGDDVWLSYKLREAGYLLENVPSVMSVWREPAPPGPWKYVHDETEA